MTTKTYGPWAAGPGARILANPLGKLAGHWLVQGVAYMDPSERAFRLATELIGLVVLYPVVGLVIHDPAWARGAAILGIHTLDFILNGQILGALKWHWRMGVTPEQLERYAAELGARLGRSGAVRSVLGYGSLARGELRTGSDLDLRVLRRPGFGNAIRASALVAAERLRGLLAGVPMDLYVWDSWHRARAMRPDEVPVVLAGEAPPGHPAGTGMAAARSLGRVAFLRGARTDRPAGATDVEVIPGLARLGWTTLLVAVGPAGSHYRASLDGPTVTAWAPAIPVLGAVVANLHALILVLRWRPEVIVVNPGMAVAGALCAILAPAVTVVTDVRSIPVESGSGLRGRLGRVPFRLACRLPRLRGLSAITPGTVAVLRRDFGLGDAMPVTTWASGARPDLFRPGVTPVDPDVVGLAPGSTTVIYHGQLTVDRGLLTLLDAFALVRMTHREAGLALLGDGPAVPALRERAAQSDLLGSVAILPSVPIDLVPSYLAAASIGVLPLPDLEWWRVSSPMKLYEYLAMGLTVVATDIEPHRDIHGILRCPPSAAGLAAAISEALDRGPMTIRTDPDAVSWDRQAARLSAFLAEARHG